MCVCVCFAQGKKRAWGEAEPEPAPVALATPYDVGNTCHLVTKFLEGERSNATHSIQCGRAVFRLRDSVSKWALEYYDPNAEAWTRVCTTKKALIDSVCKVVGLKSPPTDLEPAEAKGDRAAMATAGRRADEEEDAEDAEDAEGAEGAGKTEEAEEDDIEDVNDDEGGDEGDEGDEDESNEDDPRQRAQGRRLAARAKPSTAAAAGSSSAHSARAGSPNHGARTARRATSSSGIIGPPIGPIHSSSDFDYDPHNPQSNQLNILVAAMTAMAREIREKAARSEKTIDWWNAEFARRQAAGERDAFRLKETLDREAVEKTREFADETEATVRPLLDARDALVDAVGVACRHLNEGQAILDGRP